MVSRMLGTRASIGRWVCYVVLTLTATLAVLSLERHSPGFFFKLVCPTVTELPQIQHSDPTRKFETNHSDPTLMIDDSAARALKARARVLCWLPSTRKRMERAGQAVNDTWVTRCDGHVFFVEGQWGPGAGAGQVEGQRPWDVVTLDVPTGRFSLLTNKVFKALEHLYQHHLNQYDWFLKGDDDVYVVMENLRYLLDQHDPRTPVYLGHLFKQYHPQGYMSGGASYVLSREALKMMIEDGYRKNKCAPRGRFEDVEVGKCLHAAGVPSFNSRDRFGRDTFHPLKPEIHIVGPIPGVQLAQDRFLMVSGRDCCSQLTITFHKVDPSLMRVFDHLLYRTSVYGRVLDLPALQGLLNPGVVPPLPS
ncbi:glycoprotein-N-acetylgalactosamine 3-beta-galactosyltransferase 1-like [Babylonia areolata]|uniref:glycoprotein-N-acetylgalactosamine 3-beta-galactosyltransferase 1-like n=1 Tax=Babylonia areolata TaxID=304850 RepID=UPI003FD69B75